MRNEALNCGKCTPEDTSESTSPPGIWVFVDDSNIWIEAKKLKSKLKGFITREDHRLRIDMGKLASVIAGDRYVESGILYAAEPPPIADVWRNIETKAGWYVDRSERGRRSTRGNEKQIDAKLVADATATAIVTPPHQRTTMAFVTGDANVVPALKKIVRQEGWTVEIYMWSQSISNSLLEFAAEESDRVKIISLDDYLDKISFSQNELDVVLMKGRKNLSQWRHRQLAKPYGIVFTIQPGTFSNGNVSKEWVENLEAITKWPLQYYWFIEGKDSRTNDLVVIFKRDVLAGADFDLDRFMSRLSESQLQVGNIPHVVQIQTFREFISKKHLKEPDEELKMWDEAMEQCSICSNDSSVNDDYRATDSDSHSSSTSDKSDFKQVKRKFRRSKQRYTKSCPFKKNCINGTRCHNYHSEDDKIYFRKRKDGRGNPQRKTAMCTRFEKGICNKVDCDFAHGIGDAWCKNCLNIGHFIGNCPEPKRNKALIN